MAQDLPPVYLEFKADIKGIQDGLKTIQGDLKKFEKSSDKAGDAAKGMSAKTVAAGAIMASVFQKAATEIYKFGKETVTAFQDTGKEIRTLQRSIGGTAEDASRLRFTGDELGVSVQSLTMGFKTLASHMDANDDKIKRMGISYRDAHGALLPTKDVLASLADRFASMPDGLQKTALATDLFGKSGQRMIPILNQGKQGLRELYAESDKLGVTMSGKDLKATKDFSLAQKKLGEAIKGAQITIGKDLIPILTKLVNYVRINVVPWMQSFANGLTGKQGVNDGLNSATTFAHNLGSMLRTTIHFVIEYKNQLLLFAGALFSIWAGLKLVNGVTAVVTAIGMITAAWGGVTAAAAAAEAAESVAMVTVGAATFPMVASIGAIAAAWDVVAVSASAAAVAEDVASVGTLSGPMIAAGIAGVALVGTAVAGVYTKLKHSLPTVATAEQPTGTNAANGGFANWGTGAGGQWTPPPQGGGGGGGTPEQTTAERLQEESRKMRTRIRLLKLGASKGLVDEVMSGSNWQTEAQKLITGGRAAVAALQQTYSHTAAGMSEAAQAASAKAGTNSFTSQLKTAARQVAGRARLIAMGASAGLADAVMSSADWETEYTKLITGGRAAVSKMQGLWNKTAEGIAEVKDAHEKLAAAAKRSAEATAAAAAAQRQLNQETTVATNASNSWLAAQVRTTGITAANAGSFVNVPVIIDGQTIFRVTQKVSLQNNRRNVSNGLSVAGNLI